MINQIKSIFSKKQSNIGENSCQSTTNVASQLVTEARHRRKQMPHYPGLENYVLKEQMGHGAFSNVYKAQHRDTAEWVAIKVVRKLELDKSVSHERNHLHPDVVKATKPAERSSIIKEVQIMRNINHPNIVRLIQFTESDSYYFLILELCQGGELFNRVVHLTYFSEDLARHVIGQVGQGIRYLHNECGVVHRDIKPENILFDSVPIIPSDHPRNLFQGEDKVDEGVFQLGIGGGGIGRVKIADFGLSKVIWDHSTMTPCGTVGYTAPEIVRDQRYSKAVDMWAIGCVLYTILCGFPPFYDESIKDLTAKVASGKYTFMSPWWDPISQSAKDLISHLLCVDPHERYTIDEFFEHPWMTGQLIPNHTEGTAPSIVIEPTSDANDLTPLDTPSKSTKRKDVFSPGAPSMKEILDITYAVQRMGAEQAQYGLASLQTGSLREAILEENEDIHNNHIKQTIPTAPVTTRSVTHDAIVARLAEDPNVSDRHPANKNSKTVNSTRLPSKCVPTFELNMNNATILKNRRRVDVRS